MIAEIISIGTELILGDVIDSNSAYIAEQLTRYGYDIHYISTVGDNKKRLIKVIERAIIRADIIITTGGLGPTTDDITREAIAESTGCSLQKNTKLLENIKDYFHHKNYKMTINNERQAYLPEGAKALTNNFGTAPGFILKKDEYKIISLPGVPREMKGILENEVKPILLQDNENIIKSKTLNFFRIGESTLENKIDDIINNQNNPTIALLAGKGEVKIRITAKGCNQHKVDTLINTVEEKIRNRVGKYIYTVNDKKLEKVIGDLLNEKDMTLAVAESCTGGLIGRRITDIP
ncbi:MAG: CinA family nicotinamide mononucleotide deamidase-related protein, partial [Halanaerobiales bacterium]